MKGPVLIIANHASHFDTPVALSVLPERIRSKTAVAAAADRFYRHDKRGWWYSLYFNAFPIERLGGGRATLEYPLSLLRRGWSVLIYPEGTRSTTGELGGFHHGVALMAMQTNVPVIPIYSEGLRNIMPKGQRSPHFTFIQGGRVRMNGVLTLRPIRGLVAWDLYHLLSHLGSSAAPLPDPHRAAKTFQELLVKFYIERLGINRGPGGRRDRLRAMLRDAKRIAGADYMNELSVATSDVTASEEFWKGVSAAVPPWRFLWVAGQPADYTDHAGRDSLPGHLVERVLRDLVAANAQSFRRRGKDGRRHLEWLTGESELDTEHASADDRPEHVINRLDREEPSTPAQTRSRLLARSSWRA